MFNTQQETKRIELQNQNRLEVERLRIEAEEEAKKYDRGARGIGAIFRMFYGY